MCPGLAPYLLTPRLSSGLRFVKGGRAFEADMEFSLLNEAFSLAIQRALWSISQCAVSFVGEVLLYVGIALHECGLREGSQKHPFSHSRFCLFRVASPIYMRVPGHLLTWPATLIMAV